MSKPESPARRKWREIIQRQQTSGHCVAAFCRGNGVPASSFFAWKRKLAGSAVDAVADSPAGASVMSPAAASPSATSAPVASPSATSASATCPAGVVAGFVEATLCDPPRDPRHCGFRSDGSIQVRLRGGRRLLLRGGFDRDLLAEIVAFFEVRS